MVDYVISLLVEAEELLGKELMSSKGDVRADPLYSILTRARYSLLLDSKEGAIIYDHSLKYAEGLWQKKVERAAKEAGVFPTLPVEVRIRDALKLWGPLPFDGLVDRLLRGSVGSKRIVESAIRELLKKGSVIQGRDSMLRLSGQ